MRTHQPIFPKLKGRGTSLMRNSPRLFVTMVHVRLRWWPSCRHFERAVEETLVVLCHAD
jgi:hypothetical protein